MTKLTQSEIVSYEMLFKQTSVEPLDVLLKKGPYSKDKADSLVRSWRRNYEIDDASGLPLLDESSNFIHIPLAYGFDDCGLYVCGILSTRNIQSIERVKSVQLRKLLGKKESKIRDYISKPLVPLTTLKFTHLPVSEVLEYNNICIFGYHHYGINSPEELHPEIRFLQSQKIIEKRIKTEELTFSDFDQNGDTNKKGIEEGTKLLEESRTKHIPIQQLVW